MKKIIIVVFTVLLALAGCSNGGKDSSDTMNGIWRGKLKDPNTSAEIAALDIYLSIQDDKIVVAIPDKQGSGITLTHGRIDKENEILRLSLFEFTFTEIYPPGGVYLEGTASFEENKMNWEVAIQEKSYVSAFLSRIDNQKLSFEKLTDEEIEKELNEKYSLLINYNGVEETLKDFLNTNNEIYEWELNGNSIYSTTGTLASEERAKLKQKMTEFGVLPDESGYYAFEYSLVDEYDINSTFAIMSFGSYGNPRITGYVDAISYMQSFEFHFTTRILSYFKGYEEVDGWDQPIRCNYDFKDREFFTYSLGYEQEDAKPHPACKAEDASKYRSAISDILEKNGLTAEMFESY